MGVQSMKRFAARFLRDESGATAIEYSLIAVLCAVAIIGAMTTLGNNVSANWKKIAANMP